MVTHTHTVTRMLCEARMTFVHCSDGFLKIPGPVKGQWSLWLLVLALFAVRAYIN